MSNSTHIIQANQASPENPDQRLEKFTGNIIMDLQKPVESANPDIYGLSLSPQLATIERAGQIRFENMGYVEEALVVIVNSTPSRALYTKDFSNKPQLPCCGSGNMINGDSQEDLPGTIEDILGDRDCRKCKFTNWKEPVQYKGRKIICKEYLSLTLFNSGQRVNLPYILKITGGSLRHYLTYFMVLMSENLSPKDVITKITVVMNDSMLYPKLLFTYQGLLPGEVSETIYNSLAD